MTLISAVIPGERFRHRARWAGALSQRFLQHFAGISVAFFFAAIALALFTRNNDFPMSYHPDESGKVFQVLNTREYRNFNHPLLMLETAEWLYAWYGPLDDPRAMAQIGRLASAVVASVGVFAIAIAGYVMYGMVGAIVAGAMMSLCPPLLVYAHFFKEDASLAGAILVTLLGAAVTLRSRGWIARGAAVALLGAGVGLCASAKYFGLIAAAPALLALMLAPGWRYWSFPLRVVVFLLAGTVTVALVNHRAFEDPWTLQMREDAADAMKSETEHGTTEHRGLTMELPHAFFLRIADAEVMHHAKVLGAIGLVAMLAWHGFSRWGITLLAFVLTFAIALAYCPIPFGRYGLPITITSYVLCAMAIASLISSIQFEFPRTARWSLAGVTLVIVLFQGHRCALFNYQFRHDTRQQFREWAAENLQNAEIVADSYTMGGYEGDPWRFPLQRIPRLNIRVAELSAAQFGSVSDLRRRGVKYVVACEMSYERYIQPEAKSASDSPGHVERCKKFYEQLFSNGKLVKAFVPNPASHAYVSPEIRVYDISGN